MRIKDRLTGVESFHWNVPKVPVYNLMMHYRDSIQMRTLFATTVLTKILLQNRLFGVSSVQCKWKSQVISNADRCSMHWLRLRCKFQRINPLVVGRHSQIQIGDNICLCQRVRKMSDDNETEYSCAWQTFIFLINKIWIAINELEPIWKFGFGRSKSVSFRKRLVSNVLPLLCATSSGLKRLV